MGIQEGDFHRRIHLLLRNSVSTLLICTINSALRKMANDHITTLANPQSHRGVIRLGLPGPAHVGGLIRGTQPGTSRAILYSLISLALFILAAAWINYINLTLARALERADEIGVRKVFGATAHCDQRPISLEALILRWSTFFYGYGLYLMFTGPLAGMIFSNVTLAASGDGTDLFRWICGGHYAGCFIRRGFISKYKPALILRNKLGGGKGEANFLHQSLMVFQLFSPLRLLGSADCRKTNCLSLREFDSGFNTGQTISLRAPASTNSDSLRYVRYIRFRNEVLRNHAFRAGTLDEYSWPGIRFHDEGVHAVVQKNEKKQGFWIMWIDEGYQETFGMTLVAGRTLKKKNSTNLF